MSMFSDAGDDVMVHHFFTSLEYFLHVCCINLINKDG